MVMTPRKLPSLADLQTLDPEVRQVWERARAVVDMEKENGQTRTSAHSGEGVPDGPGGESEAPDKDCPRRQYPRRLPYHLQISLHQILGNALSVDRAIWFSSHQEAGWSVDDDDDCDRPVDIPGQRGGQ